MLDDSNLKIYLEYFSGARQSMYSRMRYRDQTIGGYMAIVGGLLSFILTQQFPPKPDVIYALLIMLPLPISCVAFSLLILQHDIMIGAYSNYLGTELPNSYPQSTNAAPLNWFASEDYRKKRSTLVSYRYLSQGILLAIPMLYPIGFVIWRLTPGDLAQHCILIVFLSIIHIGCGIIVVWRHLQAYRIRRHFAERPTPPQPAS